MSPHPDIAKAELVLSPEGHLFLETSERYAEELPLFLVEQLQSLFEQDPALGLLHLGIRDFEISLPPSFQFWQSFARALITKLCKLSLPLEDIAPSQQELETLCAQAPFIQGALSLTPELLTHMWQDLKKTLAKEIRGNTLQEYLRALNPRWNLVGRICLHMAENKNNNALPFAFLATYTTRLTEGQAPQHLPLNRALQEYAGENNRAGLLSLLVPIQKAAEKSTFIKSLVDSGAIFQPHALSAKEAHRFLKDIPLFEECGLMVRVPNWWNSQKPPRPQVSITIGETSRPVLSSDSLLDCNMKLALSNGEELTCDEWDALLNASSPLIKVKGQWVEVDKEKLKIVLAEWKSLQQWTKNGLSMTEALRLLAGVSSSITEKTEELREWSTVAAGEGLKALLSELRSPNNSLDKAIEDLLKAHLRGTLRPYQQAGLRWLLTLYQLKLGGCLADDMGLGKTIQVLALLLVLKHHFQVKRPSLLIIPASLLGNWQAEQERFAPSLNVHIEHGSAQVVEELPQSDLVITTYGFLQRSTWMKTVDWELVILDEAQMIKNPSTKQTQAVKQLKAFVRLSLTGTPVENRLGDLWSLFDFTSPGLLGTSKEFSSYTKQIKEQESYSHFMSSLRTLIQPYILRRTKSDKKIIADLPDKLEMLGLCCLSEEQVRLYQKEIVELAEKLHTAERMQRRGLVLSSLLRLKQICNHPDQWLGYGEYTPTTSGKFLRLQEICEEIAAKQEKVLIFTQFREIIPPLASFLSSVFGRTGLMLHGGTAIKKRAELVAEFQETQGPPFFILSLKAGGTGLNLTRASHVVHFDRWWNPSVENQATDRAYRIGQQQPVVVHKFVCRGTIEEKIDALIESKQKLSKDILHKENELSLTELSNEALLNLVSLDIKRALEGV